MGDNLPTVWLADPHTCAKHAVLERYLKAWFPILSQQSRRLRRPAEQILFIDGFAGPGEYEKGQPGSPVIALTAALQHSITFPVPIRLLFIEQDKERFDRLKTVLQRHQEQIEQSTRVLLSPPRQGECDAVLNEMLNEYEKRGTHFGPVLAFLDQFGYSAVSMQLIKRILAFPQCEVFSYLDYRDMNRWIGDRSKAPGFSRAWGGDEWRKAVDLPEAERRVHLLDSYQTALRVRAKAKYVCSFSMFSRNNSPLYWLIFSTNNLRGLEEMKKAMWSVDKTGGFKFSDKDNPDQLALLDKEFDQEWLSQELSRKLAGKEMPVAKVKEHVLVSTPCYKFKESLRILENANSIRITNAPPNRKPGFYPNDDIVIQFLGGRLF